MLKQVIIRYRRIFIILVHIVLLALAYYTAFLLRFEFTLSGQYQVIFTKTLPILLFIKIIVFYYFGVFYGLWRYVSIADFWQILKAATVSSSIFILSVVFIYGLVGYPRTMFILDWILCVVFVTGARIAGRLIRERIRRDIFIERKKALIIGAGQAGVLLLKECVTNPQASLKIMGFIDDDPAKKYTRIQHVKVVGGKKDISAVVEKLGIEEIILAMPSVKSEVLRDILSYCQIPGVKVRIIPALDQLIAGNLQLKPRDVRPEDILGRELIAIDQQDISDYVKNKQILITGAGGSIGAELCKQIAQFSPAQIILFDHNENDVYFLTVELKTKYPCVCFKTIIGDIRDIGLLKVVFSEYCPQVVFHAAAHKHVPLMEENPCAAVKNNIIGSRNLIYASQHYGVERFVLISTDKAVNPINIMGISKRIAEMILQAKAVNSTTKFMAVRFGNVVGSAGSVVPLFKKQIDEGGPITITHPEVKRYFMSIPEAASLVLQAAALGKGGEIFILDMGEQIKIIDVAKNLIALSGLTLDKDIQVKYTGLRSGEKLKEEILLNAEKDRVTKNKKIYITQPSLFDSKVLRRKIKALEQCARVMDHESAVRIMKEMVNRCD